METLYFRSAAPAHGYTIGGAANDILVSRSRKYVPVMPLELPGGRNLFQIFSRLRSPAKLLEFMNVFGPIKAAYEKDEFIIETLTSVDNALRLAQDFRDVMKTSRGDGEDLEIALATTERYRPECVIRTMLDEAENPKLIIQPKTLLDLMHIQLQMFMSGVGSISQCKECGEFFAAGPGTDRRLGAEFCSRKHQVSYNNKRKLKSI